MQGLPQGQGKIIWEDGSSYEGHWTYGKIDGYGTMTYVTEESDGNWICAVSYSGEWKDGLEHGKGILTFSDGTTLETTWEHGVPIQ